MTGEKKPYKPSFSELVLVVILVFLVALTRVYYGGGHSPMVVWKGELTFHDTLVDLGDVASLPHDQLLKDHRSVLYQLQDMDLIEGHDVELESIKHKHWQGRKKVQKPEAEKSETEKPESEKPESAKPDAE